MNWKQTNQKLTIKSLEERTLMMVAPLLEGWHPRLHLHEFRICASTTYEGKGEPCVRKDINSTATNKSTKPYKSQRELSMEIVAYLWGKAMIYAIGEESY